MYLVCMFHRHSYTYSEIAEYLSCGNSKGEFCVAFATSLTSGWSSVWTDLETCRSNGYPWKKPEKVGPTLKCHRYSNFMNFVGDGRMRFLELARYLNCVKDGIFSLSLPWLVGVFLMYMIVFKEKKKMFSRCTFSKHQTWDEIAARDFLSNPGRKKHKRRTWNQGKSFPLPLRVRNQKIIIWLNFGSFLSKSREKTHYWVK